MSENQTYEGWSNRETWAVALNIKNDKFLNDQLNEEMSDMCNGASDDCECQGELAEWLEDWITSTCDRNWWRDVAGCTMPEGAEMLRDDVGSLYRVDWWELAQSFLSGKVEACQ